MGESLSEQELALAVRWVIGLLVFGLGVWILLFNALRYTSIVRGAGQDRTASLPSSIPVMGSVLAFVGLWVAPVEWHPAYLGLVLAEVFSINFSVEANPSAIVSERGNGEGKRRADDE